MAIKVGIPRALFFYYYFPQWKRFFENLGAQVVVSPPTNKTIINNGVRSAVDEACLPVKIYFGHVMELRDKVDFIFTPRLVSLERKAYICPKFMGLPDMLRWNIEGLPPLIDTTFDLSREDSSVFSSAREIGRRFLNNPRIIDAAWRDACAYQEKCNKILNSGYLTSDLYRYLETGKNLQAISNKKQMKIAVMGHGYTIFDEYLSMNLIRHLQAMDVRVITPEMLAPELSEEYAAFLPKRMFWSLGKIILGNVLYHIEKNDLEGMLYVETFGCGPDSMIEDLSARYVRRSRQMPFQVITLDEHTGEAGVLTRLEAFVDMILWRGVS